MGDVQAIKRGLLVAFVGTLCLTAVIAIAGVLTAQFGETEVRILVSHVLVAVYSLFALACAAGADRQPALARLGWLTCAVGLALGLAVAWSEWWESDRLEEAAYVAFIAAFTVAHVLLIESRRRDTDGPLVGAIATATAITAATLGLLAALGIASEIDDDGFLRLLGVVAILDVLGTVVLPIARKLERLSHTAS